MKSLKSLIASNRLVFKGILILLSFIACASAQVFNVKPICLKSQEDASSVDYMVQDEKNIIYYSTLKSIRVFDGTRGIEIYHCGKNENIHGMKLFQDSLFFWNREWIKSIDLKDYQVGLFYQRKDSIHAIKEFLVFQKEKYVYERVVGEKSTIRRFDADYDDCLFESEKIKKIRVCGEGRELHVLSGNGFHVFNGVDWKEYNVPRSISQKPLNNFIWENKKQVWLVSIMRGLYLYDLEREEIVETHKEKDYKKIFHLGKDKNGLLYFLSLSGNSFFRWKGEFYRVNDVCYDFPKKVFGFFCDNENNIWLFGKGSKIYQIRNPFFLGMKLIKDKTVKQKHLDGYIVNGEYVTAYVDALYFSSSVNDVKKTPFRKGYIKRLVYDQSTGLLGILYRKPEGYFFTLFNPVSKVFGVEVMIGEKINIYDCCLRGEYLYLIRDRMLDIFEHQKRKKIRTIAVDYEKQKEKYPKNIFPKWYFSLNGEKLISCLGKRFYEIKEDSLVPISIKRENKEIPINALFLSETDSSFFLVNDSLFLTWGDSIHFLTKIQKDYNGPRRINRDDRGNLWIFGYPMHYYHMKKNRLVAFDRQSGMIDVNGNIKIPVMEKKIKRFNGHVIFQSDNYIYYFLGEDFLERYLEKERKESIRPYLVQLSVNGEKRVKEEKIVLESNERNICLDFVFPQYQNIENNVYHYRLKGDDKWNSLNNQNLLLLYEIPYGDNTLEIRAGNNLLPRPAGFLQLEISVIPPFWKTKWFYLFLIFVAQGFVALVYFAHYQQQKRISEVKNNIIQGLEKKNEEKTRKIRTYSNSLEKLVAAKSRALLETELKYQRIVDSTQEIVFVINDRKKLSYVNKEGERLLERLKLNRNDYRDTLNEESLKEVRNELASKGFVRDYRLKVKSDDGDLFFLLTLFLRREGGEEFIEGIMHDITEMERYQELLKRTQRMDHLAILSGGLAHEFNNINFVLKGNISIMEKKCHDSEITGNLDKIRHASQSIEKLTGQILSYGKNNYNERKLVDPKKILLEAIEFLMSFKKFQSMIEMENSHDIDLMIYADAVQIQQILMNLFINAVDAMKYQREKYPVKTGIYKLNIEDQLILNKKEKLPPGEYAVVYVEDFGPGIPEEALEKIFQPYFTTKSKEEGTGLGLTLVSIFLKQNNGYLRLRSEQGKGTRFDLFFKEQKMED